MADNSSSAPGLLGAITCIGSIIFAWISIDSVKGVLTIIASIVGILSGIFAIRYYWYAAKEKKFYINQNKIQDNGKVS